MPVWQHMAVDPMTPPSSPHTHTVPSFLSPRPSIVPGRGRLRDQLTLPRSASASLGLPDYSQVEFLVCGTNPSALERETARAHQMSGSVD